MIKLILTILLSVFSVATVAHPTPVWVRTPEGLPLEVRATDNPVHGTVIFAHGCNGPSQMNQPGWSERLNDAGFNTVSFDSWVWRGISGGVCQTLAVSSGDRLKEVQIVVNWIRSQPNLDSDKLFILGWSHGGGVAMAASTRKELGLTKAAALYPWCERAYASAVIPTQVHIGTADDWTPAYLCKNFYSGWFSKNPLGEVFFYEGAHHSYDFFINTDSTIYGHGAGGQIAPRTQRSDPDARELTIARVIDFFKSP